MFKGSSVWTVVLCSMVVACTGPSGDPSDRSDEPSPGGFEELSGRAAVTDRASTGGVSWVDYDGDGDDDLFVANGYDVSAEEAAPQANRLYENRGGGDLVPVEGIPIVEDDGFSSGSAWGDFDRDGDLDVYIPNQRGQENALYRNEGEGASTRAPSP